MDDYRALRFCYQCLVDFTALDANPSCDSCGNEPAEHEFVPASQLRGAVEALERLANPEHLPRTEEAVLLQGEVVEIAEAALIRLGGR